MARTKRAKSKKKGDEAKEPEAEAKAKANEEEKEEPEPSEGKSKKAEGKAKKAAAKEPEPNESDEEKEPKKKKKKASKVAEKSPKQKLLPRKSDKSKKEKKEDDDDQEMEDVEKPPKKKSKDKEKSGKSKKEKKKEKDKKMMKKKKKKEAPAPVPPPEPAEFKPSKIGEYELRFGSLEVVLAAGDLEATAPEVKFLVGRLQEDVLFGCDNEAYLSIEWFDFVKDGVFAGQGLDHLDYLPAGSLVCSVTKWCKEGFARGKDTLTIQSDAWKYAERKLSEQLDDNYESDEDSQFGDEVVAKRLKYIRKASVDSGVKGRKPTKFKAEDDDDDDEGGDDGAAKMTPRKRKAVTKKAASSPKSPKSPKKPKRGLTPRPELPVVEDRFDQKTGKVDNFDGDVERATKEVFRAVQADDAKALQAAVKSDNVIFSLHFPRSVGLPITPLMLAMVDGNVEATKLLLDDANDTKDAVTGKRAPLQKCAFPKLSTGRISGKHANYNRRKVGASRGGREGNNALLHDANGDNYATPGLHHNNGKMRWRSETIPTNISKYKDEMIDMNLPRDFDEIPKEILDVAEAAYSRTYRDHMVIENILRGGQRKAAKRYIEQHLNMPFQANSFNFLHLESLGGTPADKKKPFSKDLQSKSVAKMSSTETRFSPLACACINPKSVYLEAMLSMAPEHAHMSDSKDTSLVHYAAACEGSDPLNYLIKSHSLSKTGIDKLKEAPIHYAARAARPNNISVLLEDTDSEQKKAMLTAKTTEGFAAIHYAITTQRCDGLETIRALLEAGSDPNLPSSAPRNKVSPMHLAARVGNLEALKLLVKRGGNPAKVDKLSRSPLVHACLNGHAHIVSYLLVQGVSVDVADSSDNFPVHYAAAYGWDECLQLLIDAGANPDVKNSWKTSPLAVAVQKGRHRVSSLLFKIPSVDVNFKDDEGKTLFFRLVEGFIAEKMLAEGGRSEFVVKEGASDDEEIAALRKEMPWAMQKLLDRRDVDVATTDSAGSTALHLLCYQKYPPGGSGEKRAVALSKLILSRGKFDLDLKDAEGMTPLLNAATEANSLLLEFLIDQGASVGPSFVDENGKNICHFLLLSSECREQLKVVEAKAGKATFCAMLKAQDGLGFNPVHKAVQSMMDLPKSEKTDALQRTIQSLVNRFPDLATAPVGPISLLKDPNQLANLILGELEEEEDNTMHWQRGRFAPPATILSEEDRADATRVRKALESRDQAVPTTSDHFGKSLIHFICDCKVPKRTKELLDWILPLSKEVVDKEAGTDNNVYTPLQQLLFKTLPATDLKIPGVSEGTGKDRLKCLNLVLESVGLLLKNGAKDVNKARSGLFASPDDMKRYRDGGDAELTEEKDAENVKTLRRHAQAIVNKTGKFESAKKEIVGAFEKAMQDRKLRALAKKSQRENLPIPITHHLAHTSISIPTSIWAKLTNDCDLDLMQCDANENSLLHVALNKQNAELSRFLCEECSELVTKANSTGELPIHVVAKLDKAPLVKLVLENLKDKLDEVNRGDNSGRTAFHFSVEKAAERRGEVLDPCEILFLRAGARLDIPDGMNKRTPLHYCFLERASTCDHWNFPHSLQQGTHDRVELASSLLAAEGASECVKMADKFGRTALCYAAAYNSTVSSLLLVSKGANLFREDQDGNTPINVAVLRGHDNYTITMLKSVDSHDLPKLVDVVDIKRTELTSDSGEKIVKVLSKDVHSIVWHAIKQNLRGLVYILLDTSFPLQQAAIDALENGSFQLVRKLLTTSPPDVVRHVDSGSGRNLLHEVARVRRYQNSAWSTTLGEILLSSDISPAALTKDGQTALHIAASNGHLDLVRLLVKTDKAAVLLADAEGHTPLARFMRALPHTSLGEDKCLEMFSLLTTGIDSLSADKYNRVPRTKREEKRIEYDGIEFRLGPNKETVVAEIEAKSSVDTDKDNDESLDKVEGYSTLLIQALHANKYRVMQALVDKGVPVDSTDSKGLAALHHAVLSSSLQAAKLLLRNEADQDVESADGLSVTPLLVASFQCGGNSSSLAMAEFLIRNGADATKTSKATGASALHVACRENNFEFASLLLRGALHATAKEKKAKNKNKKTKGKAKTMLVKMGQDCALYPAKIREYSVELLVANEQASVPLSTVSEIFDCDSLCLDSLQALIKLRLESNKNTNGKTIVKTEIETTIAPPDENPNSDEEMDEDEDFGADGMFADEAEASMDDSIEDDIVDHQHQEEPGSNSDAPEEREAKRALRNYYGLESIIVGDKDAQLTKPFKAGDLVIVQKREPKEYANLNDVWMEGRVIAVHKNGTYDIDVYRGLTMKGVVRQQLRPCKTPREINWPSKAEKSNKPLKKLLETKDKQCQTPLMCVVKPVEFGSFERCKMVDLLVEHGATVDSPLLALARQGSDFLKHLRKVSGSDEMETVDDKDDAVVKEASVPHGLEPISSQEFEEETKKALVKLEARGLMKRKHEPPSINPVCEMKGVGIGVLAVETASGGDPSQYHDVIMTKVELSQYGHSENKYYKMQVVEDPNKSLFVLVTNWGQIGDYGGQKQETPFGSRDEAVTEFTKVFKSKTGNVWSEYLASNFEPKLGKYKPVKIVANGFEKPKLPNLVEMIGDADDHPDVVRKSSLPPDVTETMKAFVDPEAITAAANNIGLQQEKLPLGRLSIKTLFQAEKKLDEVEKALTAAAQKTKPEELKEKREALDQVAILSSEFYELLPTKEGDNALTPLTEPDLKEQRGDILSLKNLTVASQIVNSAFIKGSEIHPLDYAYRCLGASMSVLSKDTPERIGIEQYFRNTRNNDDLVISQVYLLNRQDEVSNKDMLNHRLLWHGTNRANVMGIIKEGLRVAPPTAMQSGNAFGAGVYFSDMVDKSMGYCRESFDINAKEMPKAYLLLADVALGDQAHVSDTDWFQKEIDESVDSVWAVGYEGPGVEKDVVLRTSGAVMPLGKVTRSPTFKPKAQWSQHYRTMSDQMSEAIEAARSSPDTTYPVRIKTEYQSHPAEAVLESGPFAETAKVVPVKVRKVKEKSSGDNKKRKDNEGKSIKTENGTEGKGDGEVEYEETFREMQIQRRELEIGRHVHYNEFIVKDAERINLRFLVEVTSKAWLVEKAKRTGWQDVSLQD